MYKNCICSALYEEYFIQQSLQNTKVPTNWFTSISFIMLWAFTLKVISLISTFSTIFTWKRLTGVCYTNGKQKFGISEVNIILLMKIFESVNAPIFLPISSQCFPSNPSEHLQVKEKFSKLLKHCPPFLQESFLHGSTEIVLGFVLFNLV